MNRFNNLSNSGTLLKPNNRSKIVVLVTTLFFALTIYGLGAAMMDSQVIYPSWYFVGEDEFKAFHQEAGQRIVKVFVIPFLVSTLFHILLFWFRPKSLPLWTVWLSFLLMMTGWISSVLIQIPIQLKLDEVGYSKELLDRLTYTDLLYRTIPGFLKIILTTYMVHLVVKGNVVVEKER